MTELLSVLTRFRARRRCYEFRDRFHAGLGPTATETSHLRAAGRWRRLSWRTSSWAFEAATSEHLLRLYPVRKVAKEVCEIAGGVSS